MADGVIEETPHLGVMTDREYEDIGSYDVFTESAQLFVDQQAQAYDGLGEALAADDTRERRAERANEVLVEYGGLHVAATWRGYEVPLTIVGIVFTSQVNPQRMRAFARFNPRESVYPPATVDVEIDLEDGQLVTRVFEPK